MELGAITFKGIIIGIVIGAIVAAIVKAALSASNKTAQIADAFSTVGGLLTLLYVILTVH